MDIKSSDPGQIPSQIIPELHRLIVAGLLAEAENLTANPETLTELSCPECGCHTLEIIASGIDHDGTVAIAAHDGVNIVRLPDPHPIGSAVITVLECRARHIIIEHTRSSGGRLYRGAAILPASEYDISALSGGES